MSQCDEVNSSIASLVIPHGITWFRVNSSASSPWTDDENCDVAFMSFEFINIYKLSFVKSTDSTGYYFSFLSRFRAHDQNVHAICYPLQFSVESISNKCFITCGNDRFLRIWSNENSDCYKLDREIQLGQDVVPNTCAACVVSGSLCVLSASISGHIIIWEPSNPVSVTNPFVKKFSKYTASCCLWMPPDDKDGKKLLAIVGYSSGDIYGYTYDRSSPMNKNSCSQTFKISAHNFEVCCIVPLPNLSDGVSGFASAGRDAEIRVFSLADMKCKYSHRFKTFQKGNSDNGQDSSNSQGKAWIPLASTALKTCPFLAFDTTGNLHAFDAIDKPQICESSVSSLQHHGLVCSFISIPNSPQLFLSFGRDCKIIAWKKMQNDWHALTPVASIPCISGQICSLSQGCGACSPLALGLIDGSVMIMRNVTPPEPNSFISVNRFSPLPPSAASSRITALAWHPDPLSENLIAIGSSRGHVEVIDVLKAQNRSRNFNHIGSFVYRVTWGPKLFDLPDKEVAKNTDYLGSRLLVYAVANGCIYLLVSRKKPPLNISAEFTALLPNSEDHKLAELSFKEVKEEGRASYSWLIGLGSMNGSVSLFGLSSIFGSVIPLSRIDIHKKYVISMAWSHHADKYWLAVSSGESFVTVIDATEQAVNAPAENSQPLQLTSCMANLQGHGSRIAAIDWSRSDPDLLLTGSYDCTSTVWRVGLGTSTAIANYRGHLSRVYVCAWSPDITDFVFSGECLGYLIGWRPSAQGIAAPPLSRKNRNPCAKIPSCANSEHTIVPSSEQSMEVKLPPPNEPSASQLSAKNAEPHACKKPSLLPSLFATPSLTDVSIPLLSQSPPIKMQPKFEIIANFVAYMKDPSSLDSSSILPEFDLLSTDGGLARRRELVCFTESEAQKHLEAASGSNRLARLDCYFSLLLWLGRCQLVAKRSVELQYMPFWLMWALEMVLKGPVPRPTYSSLVEGGDTPTEEVASDDFLQHRILQLAASNEYTWASTLLVCAGRTRDAVKVLLQCGRAKEALLLFRLRLNPEANSELHSQCLALLAEKQLHTGLPNSALAFIAAGEINKAVSVIRGNSDANLPPLDRMVIYWTSLALLPSKSLFLIRLIQACVAYAANLIIDAERKRFIDQWRTALSPKPIADYLLSCASFLLLSDCREDIPTTESLEAQADEIAQVVFDRQPSLDEAECLAGVVLDFGIATIDAKYTANVEKSLELIKDNHPDLFNVLVSRLNSRKSETSPIPSAFEKICQLFE